MTAGLGTAPLTGPWDRERTLGFLHETRIPVRIAAVDDRGSPRVTSLWFCVRGDEVCCAVRPGSRLARWAAARPVLGFEVAADRPPYLGVRGAAEVRVDPGIGAEVLEVLIARYLGPGDARLAAWLRSRAASEVALRLRPTDLESWDYRGRMAG